MKGLYDRYRQANSNVIPTFNGTTAPEALKVGEHLQGMYDMAFGASKELQDGVGELQTLSTPSNLRRKKEIQEKILGEIDAMSKAGDWENSGEKVKALARYYVRSANELAAPLKQYQEYEKTLDDKDKNLTPEQKKIMIARSLYAYENSARDNSGRVNQFSGIEPAKNIDVNKKVDTWLNDIAVQMGGSEVANDNGEWKVKRQGEWKRVDAGTIERTLQYAMNNDMEYQSYKRMMGDNAGFLAMTGIQSLDQLDPSTRMRVEERVSKGEPVQSALYSVFNENQVNEIENLAHNYGKTKYAYNNKWSSSETGIGAVETAKRIKELENEAGMFGDAITDAGIDVTAQFGSAGDVETKIADNAAIISKAQTDIDAQKAVIADYWLKTKYKEAKGFSPEVIKKQIAVLTPQMIDKYFADKDPQGRGRYTTSLQALEGASQTQATLNQMRDAAMDIAVKNKFPGKNFDGLKKEATQTLSDVFKKDKLELSVRGNKINSSNIDNYEVVDGDKGFSNPSNYIVLRDKISGQQYKIRTNGSSATGKEGFDKDSPDGYLVNDKVRNIGGKFDGLNWKDTWKDVGTNTRSNSITMSLLNHTTPDGKVTKAGAYAERVKSVLSGGSGGLQLYDMNNVQLGSGKTSDMKARISAGAFTVNGFTKRNDGRLYVKVSVIKDKSATDPGEEKEEVLVAADTNLANKLSAGAIQAGMRDNDVRAVQFGAAMAPGSGYEKVLGMGTLGRLQISDFTGGKKGAPLYEVVANPTGSSSGAITYELYKINADKTRSVETSFNDAFDLGYFLDMQTGRLIEKKTDNK